MITIGKHWTSSVCEGLDPRNYFGKTDVKSYSCSPWGAPGQPSVAAFLPGIRAEHLWNFFTSIIFACA